MHAWQSAAAAAAAAGVLLNNKEGGPNQQQNGSKSTLMDPTCAARTLAGLRLRHRNHLQRVHSHRRVVASRLQMNKTVKLIMLNVLKHPETSVEGAMALQTHGTKYATWCRQSTCT